ncbi:MAG: type IIL restriction-modification enzyme MmeI, partial [Methylococcaceae bacterium]
AAWYRKAVDYMADNPALKTAFVSTNSITQGEQVGVLWPDLLRRGVKIHFAHRTFQWSSEARGKAAVHCVIIGFALHDAADKRIFDYETSQAEAHEVNAKNINPYLVDAPDVVVVSRSTPICAVSKMINGSKPTDGGNLLLTSEENTVLLAREPQAEKWIRPYAMSDEFINNIERYCLWLVDCPPDQLRKMPVVMERVELVRKMRTASTDSQTKKDASTPTLFQKIRQPISEYLVIPRVSSERRFYIPIAFASKNLIAGETLQTIPNATLYHFGVLTSAMHMGWMRSVCGRLKSDYRYSAGIVYNAFPWPENVTDRQKQSIEEAAQAILDARAKHPGSSLADLYDPLSMPPELVKAHHKLDLAVDAAYSKKKFSGDSDRAAFLFELYQRLISQLEVKKPKRRKLA